MTLQSKKTPLHHDIIAPDGSQIRLLVSLTGGSMAHCSLPAGGVSKAVKHRSVEEVWYFLSGRGEVWRRMGGEDHTVPVEKGWSVSIPLGAHFQFCNTGVEPLEFVIVTMPPWPGEEEAERVPDRWEIREA